MFSLFKLCLIEAYIMPFYRDVSFGPHNQVTIKKKMKREIIIFIRFRQRPFHLVCLLHTNTANSTFMAFYYFVVNSLSKKLH